MRRQLRRLGLAHDPRRSVATIDPDFYRWTQWIFLQIFNSWYDAEQDKARPIAELIAELADGTRPVPPRVAEVPTGATWHELDAIARRRVVDAHRLAYLSRRAGQLVPGAGHRPGQRGGHRRRPQRARQLPGLQAQPAPVDDADHRLRRPAAGRPGRPGLARGHQADAAQLDRPLRGCAGRLPERPPAADRGLHHPPRHAVRRDVHGAGARAPDGRPAGVRRVARRHARGVDRRRGDAARRGRRLPPHDRDAHRRRAPDRGPRQDRCLHRRLRDEPGHRRADPGLRRRLRADGLRHRRDHGGARPGRARLGVRDALRPADRAHRRSRRRAGRARPTPARARRSTPPTTRSAWTGWTSPTPRRAIIDWLEERGFGRRTITYKLRDWLFSRQRYWGEPFPIVYDEDGLPDRAARLDAAGGAARGRRLLAAHLRPRTTPPASRSRRWPATQDWVDVDLDLGDGPKRYRRETNTMPQWAGSCWYELRYLDPTNTERFVDPEVERYWMGPREHSRTGGVDLYVGGAEHAVLHLLYARFWHKVLFDLGHVSSSRAVPPAVQPGLRPGLRLHRRARHLRPGRRGRATSTADGSFHVAGRAGQPRVREDGQEPEEHRHARRHVRRLRRRHLPALRDVDGAAGRLSARGRRGRSSARSGSCSGCGATSSTRRPATYVSSTSPPDDETRRLLHRTIDEVRKDYGGLRFNTAIAQAHRAEQPPDVKAGATHARGRRAAGADGGAAGPAHRRGAVVPAGPRAVAGLRAVPGGRPGAAGRGHR